jgi:hypothetical protein
MARSDLTGLSKQISETIKDLSAKDSFFRKYLDHRDQEYSVSTDEFFGQMSEQYKYIKKYSSVEDFDTKLKELCAEYVDKVYTEFKTTIGKTKFTSNQKTQYAFTKDSTKDNFTVIATTIEEREAGDKFKALNAKKRTAFTDFKNRVVEVLFNNYRDSSGFIRYDRKVRKTGEVSSRSKYEQMEKAIFGSITLIDKENPSQGVRLAKTTAGREIAFRSGGTAQAGHREGTSVNKLLKETILSSISSKDYDRKIIVGKVEKTIPAYEISSSARTYIRNALNGGKSRTLKEITSVIKFFDQSSRLNQAASSTEKSELNRLPDLIIDSIIADMGITGLAEQKASPNGFELNEMGILKAIQKGFGKKAKINSRVNLNQSDIKTTSPKLKVSKKVTTTKLKDSRAGNPISIKQLPTRKEYSSSAMNWNSLLPIINSRLTPRVIANMRLPSLVNRTGRFAQSAEVVRIEETREGFPSFVFNYERDPYDVFDRTLGRAPWNTPERDPRALVDKSVREIIREMAISRFYTRRA